jgi:UDP-N-acetylmuramoyl-tripeptide--D-alanyl-D-alanine ligase
LKIRIGNISVLSRAVQRTLDRREAAMERRAISRRPRLPARFVGVTGSSGKTTTAALLSHILAAAGKVQGQFGANVYKTLIRTIARLPSRTDFVVAECGAGRPGHIEEMAAVLRPDVAIVTLVALEHKSAFRTIEAVAAEKGELVAHLAAGGTALLNADDPRVAAMAALTTGRVATFGRDMPATYRASAVSAAFPRRLTLTVTWPGGELPLRTRLVGEHFWLPATAAVAAALELGVAPGIAAERVATFEPVPAAGGVIETPSGASIILDTTKAPWHSVPLAFDIVARSTAPRRRIFLGHMSDFAGSDDKYRRAYQLARAAADEVVFIGHHKHRSKASPEDIEAGRFRAFATPREAAAYLHATLKPGEVVLVKGSSDLHLERLGLSQRLEVKCWVDACGKRQGCFECRRYGDPYEWHKGRKKRIFRKLLHFLRGKPAPPAAPLRG